MIVFYQLNTKGAFVCAPVIVWDALATLSIQWNWIGKGADELLKQPKKGLGIYSTQVIHVTFNGLLCFFVILELAPTAQNSAAKHSAQ